MNLLRIFRRIIKWAIAVSLLVFVSLAGFYLYPVIPDPEPDFLPRKGQLIDSRMTREFVRHNAVFQDYTLTSDSGLSVEVNIRRPRNFTKPRPLVIILGGYGTGRRATELVDSEQDAVIVSLNYPYEGDRRMEGISLLFNIPHVQQALFDIAPATMLTLDYLLQQPYVDHQQVELAGVSLGAFVAAIPGAMDTRVTRVWLVQGAGDPKALFAYRLEKSIGSPWWRDKVAGLIALIGNVHHLTPERWVGRISPRPVIAVNSRQDVTFPPGTVKALHDAIKEPREIIWIEGEHVRPSRHNVVRQLTDIVLSRVDQGMN